MVRTWRSVGVLGCGVTLLVGTLGGCSSSGSRSAPTTGSTAVSGSPAPALNPLTGEAKSDNPVVAVKIEDTALGRPQSGVDKADIVYVEQVEGGLTRLLAIFNTHLPSVEPVRSVRPSDPELALQFGHIIFVASGGSRAGIAPLDRSPLKSVINDRGAAGFSRDPNRQAPENLRANLAKIAAKVGGPAASDIGLTWSRHLPTGKPQSGTTVKTLVGATAVRFDWNTQLHRYVRIIDGRIQHASDGKVIDTPNVIVQFCRVTTYAKDRDVLGNPAKYTHTLGHGRAVVFRDGLRIDGTWHRSSVTHGTSLTTAAGRPIPLAPGGAWFVLVATGTPLS